jgi:hypothetical protein
MSLEPTYQEKPEAQTWPADQLPDECPAECFADSRIVGRVLIWHIQVLRGVTYLDAKTRKPKAHDLIDYDGVWYYFDQHGCHRYPPPGSPSTTGGYGHFHRVEPSPDSTMPLSYYWGIVEGPLRAFFGAGPGAVELWGDLTDALNLQAEDLDE